MVVFYIPVYLRINVRIEEKLRRKLRQNDLQTKNAQLNCIFH